MCTHVHIENTRENYPSQMLFHTLPLLFATDKARSFVLCQEAFIHPSSSTFSFSFQQDVAPLQGSATAALSVACSLAAMIYALGDVSGRSVMYLVTVLHMDLKDV